MCNVVKQKRNRDKEVNLDDEDSNITISIVRGPKNDDEEDSTNKEISISAKNQDNTATKTNEKDATINDRDYWPDDWDEEQNMKATMRVNPHFENFIFDWDYEKYLLIGSYGSSKSHSIVQKLIIKLYEEKRKVCVFRQVADTHKESTFDLIKQVLDDAGLLAEEGERKHKTKVCWKTSPLEFKFPNGSRIIFKGLDSTEKIKSLNGVSIVWIEECSEITEAAYLELLGRIRTPGLSMHFILSCNPVGKFNWVYQHFFSRTNDDGSTTTVLRDETLYER